MTDAPSKIIACSHTLIYLSRSLEMTHRIHKQFLKISGLVLALCSPTFCATAADSIAPYRYQSNFDAATNTLSAGCAYIDSSSTNFGEALSIDFKLINNSLMLKSVDLKPYRPLIGCDDSFEVSLSASGEVTSVLFETKNLSIGNDRNTTYELITRFDSTRNPVSSAGGYKFDQIQYKLAEAKTCSEITALATPVSAQEYWENVSSLVRNAEKRGETDLIDNMSDPDSKKLSSGPVTHWFYGDILNYAKTSSTTIAEDFSPEGEDFSITKAQFDALDAALCSAYQGTGSKRDVYNAAAELAGFGLFSPQFANNWGTFDYIDTGAKIIDSPSPTGLEYYTKYTTAAGVIIVAGDEVDDDAMLAVREAYIYMTSARPEMRGILQRNNARVSLFNTNASALPEYGADKSNESGGFAQTRSDPNMTANATMYCYPGNAYAGGNVAIHEMGHTLNHLVFEETNETYWYDRIWNIANADRAAGKVPEGLPLSEYWAKAVEGYIMDAGPEHANPFATREDIKENHPEVYELLVRYFPTTKFNYCSQ